MYKKYKSLNLLGKHFFQEQECLMDANTVGATV